MEDLVESIFRLCAFRLYGLCYNDKWRMGFRKDVFLE